MSKENRKEIKVSTVMWPYVRSVLKRDEISYETKKENGKILLLFSGNGKRFTEVLEDALCEKQRAESSSKLPVYSYRTLRNHEKRDRLMKLNNRRGFFVLKQDAEKVRRCCI